ncbi:response regulator [Thalassospira marina]|uniref:histidine kinase n=1 Tax=Thalassospira marina TaxID=2048283 RepID=A0ABM6QAW1_9PROT|nr:response regulator [Thalassospira marina]AUG53714.1 hybrid sensor histidine kinase/response regulator [Thalassospira marina]
MNENRFRILLVEDNPGDAFLVQTLLEEAGETFDIEHRINLAGALELLSAPTPEKRFDVVLLDLTLPDSSGVQTISRIRDADGRVPIVVLTGHKDEELAFDALQHGAEDYLTKEFPDGRMIRRSIRYAIERSRSEQALKESEERYRKLVELAPELIAVLSGETISYVNRQGLSILGFDDADTVTGMSIFDLLLPDSREIAEEHIDRYARGYNGRADFVVLCRRTDGVSVELEVSAMAFTHEGAPAMLIVAEDVTEKRKIERQLVQTSKLATLGEMAASVAHEMNQPLNVIRMAADTCALQYEMDMVSPAFQREKLELISGQTERMAEIIRHLRVYSRPDEDDFELFEPMQAVERAVNMVEHDCHLAGIAMDVVISSIPCQVSGRLVQLEQVLVNMLTNSRDAIVESHEDFGSTGGLIRVTATVDAENELLRIAVNDNGGGIPQDAIDLIFHPFFTTKDVGKGTGLGLSVSYGIVEGMGGEIEARNEGDGACFEIILPAVNIGKTIEAPLLDDVDGAYCQRYHSDPDKVARRGNIRIMVVDDEVDAMDIISAYLEGQGYAVSAANDGADALAIAGVITPDILITDIRMPQMDGNQLIRQMRERNPMIPVIVMTGHPGDAEMPHDTGDDAPVMVMAKPLDLKELHAIVDELVQALDIGG